MTETMLTAIVAPVKIGHLEIEGLLFPDGSFGVAVPQICSLFSFATDHASRDIKAILGGGFQFAKARTTLNPKAVNVLQIRDVEFDEVAKLKGLTRTQAIIEAINLWLSN